MKSHEPNHVVRRRSAAPAPARAKTVVGETSEAFNFRDPDRQFLLVEEHHSELLASFAARALRDGRFQDAFMYADRRCRIGPIAGASDFLLRATALARLGDSERAHDDLRKAVEIDPNHILANRTLLLSASHDERICAAKALIRNDAPLPVLEQALQVLKAQDNGVVGRFSASLDGARGWIVWQGSQQLELHTSWDTGGYTILVDADASHPLAPALGFAADLLIEWPKDATFLMLAPKPENFVLLDPVLLRPNANVLVKAKSSTLKSAPGDAPRKVAIIVPIYSDYDATTRCLATLLSDRDTSIDRRLIIVDDASPDPRMRKLAQGVAIRASAEFIAHDANLGFARSVNDAIEKLTDEDVLLLNADTVPPPGFLARLAHAAYSSDYIGTVTPFSNNGEYTSFPTPFRENRLPELDRIIALDRLAAKVNRDRVVDMPNGTGFCMYITRACLDVIGPLSTEFGRGYFEDVEFCLRAAMSGFRNVCATDVFVGHAGSKSFGADKRALVVRNLGALEIRFPDYRATSATFMAADPLATAREAIERAAIRGARPAHLLIVGEATPEDAIEDRCRELALHHERVLIGTARLSAGQVSIKLRDPAGGIPQGIQLVHPLDGAEAGLCQDLQAFPIAGAEIFDLFTTPTSVVKALRMLGIPFDVVVRDNEIAHAPAARTGRKHTGAQGSGLTLPKGLENAVFGCEYLEQRQSEIEQLWLSTLSAAGALIVSSDQTASLLASHFGPSPKIKTISKVPLVSPARADVITFDQKQPRLGVLCDGHASSFAFMTDLARIVGPRSGVNIVVIGSTFDDLRMMSAGPVFCTGPIERTERQATIAQYGVTHLLFLDEPEMRNDSLEHLSTRAGIPAAYLTPSVKKTAWLENGDVVIPFAATMPVIADIMDIWIPRAHGGHHG